MRYFLVSFYFAIIWFNKSKAGLRVPNQWLNDMDNNQKGMHALEKKFPFESRRIRVVQLSIWLDGHYMHREDTWDENKSTMGFSCAERQRVTIYFDICSNVIFHWYGKQKKREGFKGNMMRERKRKLRGLQREEANSESSEITWPRTNQEKGEISLAPPTP